MTTRTRRASVVFKHPFLLKEVGRELPAGAYEVVTDEELIEGLSFPVYHRVATMMVVPAASHQASSVEMVIIDPRQLEAAQHRDAVGSASGGGTTAEAGTAQPLRQT